MKFRPALVLVLAGLTSLVRAGDPPRVQEAMRAMFMRIEAQNDRWYKDGDFPRIVQALRFQSDLYPESEDVLTNLGWMLSNIERDPETILVYAAFRRRFPNNPNSPYPEANHYFLKKAYDRIPALLEPSLKLKEKPHPNSYRILAHAYDRLGLLADSERVWMEYLKLLPNDAPAKLNLEKVRRKRAGGK
jgi:tetratricopeptide (TPR) repeat protein